MRSIKIYWMADEIPRIKELVANKQIAGLPEGFTKVRKLNQGPIYVLVRTKDGVGKYVIGCGDDGVHFSILTDAGYRIKI